MKFTAPMLFASSVNLGPDLGPVPFDSGELSSPNREAVAISEMRVYTAYPSVVDIGDGYPSLNMGREVLLDVQVGPHRITRAGGMPVWNFSPLFDRTLENPRGVLGCFRWRFARPLFVPPGMAFMVKAQRSLVPGIAYVYPDPVPITVSFVGQMVSADYPRHMVVPYASCWAPTPVDAAVSMSDFTSDEDSLKNELRVPVELQYATGRLAQVGVPVPPPVGDGYGGVVDTFGAEVSAPCQMSLNGVDLIPPATEFNLAFDYAKRTFPLAGLVLEPSKRPVFRMKMPVGWGGYWAPSVAIVGARKEVVP